ncbi:VgrG protein [Rubrivivax sp. A210]|uniref:phage baseplate assembly protein V n=1 Tax=Rubrivivax sp. A210 TaxID=2772301 RepID=UPI0019184274|nr:phage baseplate assembly protein V [Rubrivivax sp. A210]CAD5367081.1 VgrG protein [Rubrivivax sp. A210]
MKPGADDDDDGQRRYGKYRGTVVNNLDPEQRGRIQAIVPDVQGLTPLTWALPCVPVAGIAEGLYAVPPVGAAVWIEFEQGDADYPIWVGGFWGSFAEVPPAAFIPPKLPSGQNIVLQTTGQQLLMISDGLPAPVPKVPTIPPAPPGTGGIVLRSASGATIVVNDMGIFLNNGQGASIQLVGPAVLINPLV